VRASILSPGPALAAPIVRRAVRTVLAGERVRAADVSVTQVSAQRMRALNRRAFGRDRATDVVAFGMRHGPRVVGDVYVCPAVAARSAARFGVSVREELVRLVVHGVLHALGHDHPGTVARERTRMWRRQERYVRAVLRPARDA
jgi:probable rRNA maturation factor